MNYKHAPADAARSQPERQAASSGHGGRATTVAALGARAGWKGGYRYIHVERRKIAEHRHIVERREGRKLKSNEIVHHVDWNPLNNDPDNLVILTRVGDRCLLTLDRPPQRRTREVDTSRGR